MGFFSNILKSPVVGGLASGALSLIGGERANSATAASTQAQMDFQERMSSTEYQRTMADMKAAGLNPILSAKLGGAGSPAGASTTFQNVGATAADGFSKGMASAKEASMLASQIKNLDQDTELKQEKKWESAESQRVLAQEAKRKLIETTNLIKMGKILDEDLTSAKRNATQSRQDMEVLNNNDWLRKMGTFLRELGVSGNSALSTMRK
jgi:hypothetical protein